MARCFAFPQPGYVWNGETGDALVMSLKVSYPFMCSVSLLSNQ